jgi:hypothetical protein
MRVGVFTLCDCAKGEGLKMNIMGAFNTIFARETPVVYPLCALAAILRFERIQEGPKALRISFIDSDGNAACLR